MDAIFLENFFIKNELPRGTLCRVFHAVNSKSGEEVILKSFILPNIILESQRRGRYNVFRDEIKKVPPLKHPNIFKVKSFFIEEGNFFIEMESLPGKTLAEIMKENLPMKMEEGIHIFLKCAEALSYANKQGVYHKYLKPSNIYITDDGKVKVQDFGHHIQNILENEKELIFLDAPPRIINYFSPEQLQYGEYDEKSDIYSLCAVMYEFFTGHCPFQYEEREHLEKAVAGEIPNPPRSFNPKLPEVLDYIIMKGLEKDPERRHQDMEELLRDLRYLVDKGGIDDTGIQAGQIKKVQGMLAFSYGNLKKKTRNLVNDVMGKIKIDIPGLDGKNKDKNAPPGKEKKQGKKKEGIKIGAPSLANGKQGESYTPSRPGNILPFKLVFPRISAKHTPTLLLVLFGLTLLIGGFFIIRGFVGYFRENRQMGKIPSNPAEDTSRTGYAGGGKASPESIKNLKRVGTDTTNSSGTGLTGVNPVVAAPPTAPSGAGESDEKAVKDPNLKDKALVRVYCDKTAAEIIFKKYYDPSALPIEKYTKDSTTPVETYLVPGVYSLRITREDYRDYEARLEVMKGQQKNIRVKMTRNEPRAQFHSTPAEASVFLDNRYYGKTPLSLFDIPYGRHNLVMKKDGYSPFKLNISIRKNDPLVIRGGMERDDSEEIADDENSIEKPGETSDLEVDGNEKISYLTIKTNPPGAMLFINGNKLGLSPLRNVPHKPGNFTLTTEKSGYEETKTKIQIPPGTIREVIVGLPPSREGEFKPQGETGSAGKATGNTPAKGEINTDSGIAKKLIYRVTLHPVFSDGLARSEKERKTYRMSFDRRSLTRELNEGASKIKGFEITGSGLDADLNLNVHFAVGVNSEASAAVPRLTLYSTINISDAKTKKVVYYDSQESPMPFPTSSIPTTERKRDDRQFVDKETTTRAAKDFLRTQMDKLEQAFPGPGSFYR